MITTIHIATPSRTALIDITGQVQQAIPAGLGAGLCHLFVPHTTAGLTINENADPDVKHDLLASLGRLVPARGDYAHSEGNSPAHVKASLMGASLLIPIRDGRLVLGTWQGILFCEFDGPRQRSLIVNVVPSPPL